MCRTSHGNKSVFRCQLNAEWGEGIGLEDDMYITNEEWITYEEGKPYVGISMHAMDLAQKVDYAVGSVTVSGFEKIVELKPQHSDYVVLDCLDTTALITTLKLNLMAVMLNKASAPMELITSIL